MSVGALWAGIEVRLAVEANTYAARTYASNHRNVDVLNQPIQKVEQSI